MVAACAENCPGLGREINPQNPADHRRADAAGDVIMVATPQAPPQRRRAHRFWTGILASCLSDDERAEGEERRFAAPLELLGHVFLDLMHGHVARAFVHHLHAFGPRALGQFALHFEFAELRLVVGVRD